MEIKRIGSRPSGQGPADYFTGTVRIDPLFNAPDPARAVGASVSFEPGARSAWHGHPCGQTLIVTAGLGWTQCWGEAKEEIRPGDVVWFAPGEKWVASANSDLRVGGSYEVSMAGQTREGETSCGNSTATGTLGAHLFRVRLLGTFHLKAMIFASSHACR